LLRPLIDLSSVAVAGWTSRRNAKMKERLRIILACLPVCIDAAHTLVRGD